MITIKRLLKTLFPVLLILVMTVQAYAYNVVHLPESMSFADALGVFDTDDINRITISNISDGEYTEMTRDEILDFYYLAQNMTVYRSLNATPFRGISVNIYTEDDVKSYYLGSGIQIGLYGDSNYICYKTDAADTEKLLYLDSMYHDAESRKKGEDAVHRDTSKDFLKLPSAQWAQSFAKEAAAKSLLPYDFTGKYSNYISREEFCILLGNMIAVKDGYASLEAYMTDKGAVYLNNYFEDCAGVDDSVNMLYALGIVNGKDETHFDPHGTLTREEAATLLCRTAELYMWIGTETDLAYEDVNLISPWAKFFVTWVNEYGIMTGMSETEFAPQEVYTVEQALATMVRLHTLLAG